MPNPSTDRRAVHLSANRRRRPASRIAEFHSRRVSADLSRVDRDLAMLPAGDAMNELPCLLWDWLNDERWAAACLQLPRTERRAWLAELGKAAFERDCGGYASFLRSEVRGLEYLWPQAELDVILRQHTQLLFVNLADVLDMRYAQYDDLWQGVTISGAEHIRAAVQAGRGVMALSVHQSHPGFAFLHPQMRDIGVSAVANLGSRDKPHTSLLLDGLRERVEILPTTAAALRPMLSRLANGGCTAIYADFLYPDTPGVLSTLFGGPFMIASAPISVALRTRAAVIPVSIARCGAPQDDDVHVRFGAPLPLDGFSHRDPAAHDSAALCFGVAIECLIRLQPSCWRLWPTLRYRWRCAEERLALNS